MENWEKEWQEGQLDLDDESVQWMRSRPASVKTMMLKFPPSCLVRAKRELKCPALGTVGIVTSYYEPDEEHPSGLITVRQHPDANSKSQCQVDWLEVVGYYRGVTPERVKTILE